MAFCEWLLATWQRLVMGVFWLVVSAEIVVMSKGWHLVVGKWLGDMGRWGWCLVSGL